MDHSAAAAAEVAETAQPLSLNFDALALTKDAQNQHGLRHGDYQRYRQYCARRIQRMRNATHLSQKCVKGKNVKPVPIVADSMKDPRSLHILLFDAERAWAYAMQLKEEIALDPRKHDHMVRRMKKAADLATKLEDLTNTLCDERTALHAKAYASWFRGLNLIEKKNWQDAIVQLTAAKAAYAHLGSTGKADQEALCNLRIEEIEPSLRYCTYNLSKKGVNSADISKLLNETEKKAAPQQSEEAFTSVSWLGRELHIKNQKIRDMLVSAKDLETILQASLGSAKNNMEVKMASFDKLLIAHSEMVNLALNDIRADEAAAAKVKSAKGDENSALLKSIHACLSHGRLLKVIERNQLLAENTRKILEGSSEKKVLESAKPPKPEDLVRLYDNIYQNWLEIRELPELSDSPKYSQDADTKILVGKAHRVFYAGWAFENGQKWPEALALYNRSSEIVTEAKAGLKNLLSKDDAARDQADLTELEKFLRIHKTFVKASGFLENNTAPGATAPSVSQSFQKFSPLEDVDLKQTTLVAFPPTLEPIPCKPMVFDLADNFVDYPSVSHRSKQKSGITGMLSSLWGR